MLDFFGYLRGLLFGNNAPPPPPAPPPTNSYYGFRWTPGNGAPATLVPATLLCPIPPGQAGLYIGFQNARVDPSFFRLPAAPGFPAVSPVYEYNLSPFMQGAPAPAVTNLIAHLQAHPPANEDWNLTLQTEIDLTGFLMYCAWCLNLIHQTAAGALLLNALHNGAQQIIVGPYNGGNAAGAIGPAGAFPMMNSVAAALASAFLNPTTLNKAPIRAAIDQHYTHLGPGLPRYNQLAADVNAMPLHSLFVTEGAAVANFLQAHYLYHGAPITGQQLMNWLSIAGDAAFEAWLTTNTIASGANLRAVLFQAMTIVLIDDSAPNAGIGTSVSWNILDEGDNQMGTAGWRPPAIALAHELTHAFYNAGGAAAGYSNGNYTTTAAELQVVGMIPFNNLAMSENRVRAQWANVNAPGPDPSNTNNAALNRRTVYDAPVPPETDVTMRASFSCI